MSHRLLIALCCAFLTLNLALQGAVHKPDNQGWGTDWAKAEAQSKSENKYMLLDFSGSDWCVWCQKLDTEIYQTPAFREYAAKNLVLLRVDFPQRKPLPPQLTKQNAMLKDKFGVEVFPTVLVLDPHGEPVGHLGYMEEGPTAFIAELERLKK